jgi:chaperonin GroEL (HSP60 family)
MGVNTLRHALEEPVSGIVSNTGMDGGVERASVQRAQNEQKNPNIGYAVIGEYRIDMLQAASSIRPK